MSFEFATNPALVLAFALAAGITSQIVARHLRIPGIVVLLAAGVVLGPELLGIVDPGALGHAMHDVVGFAVAVILFEGGLNLNVRRLRREALPIRRLLTVGAVVTMVGATMASRYVLGWSWSLAVLFGSLVIVTGPTVITPLLRRIRVHRNLETILEAEGVFIDAIGAILAIVVLEIVVQGPDGENLAHGLTGPPLRLGAGAAVGLVGGAVLTLLLRPRNLVPEGMHNTFSLAWAVALFFTSNALAPETGIAAVIVAGMVVGNTTAAPPLRELKEFKEQLTLLLIGLLFVLLSADVELDQITALGTGGVVTVLLLMVVIRPVAVVAAMIGTVLNWRQRAFVAWVSPRGIVAAAISSLFADRLNDAGMAGGDELQALVFLVIGGTVVLQGASASLAARLLGLRRPTDRGYAILGAHALARLFALRLQQAGEEVVILDLNQDSTRKAQAQGLRVVFGNALEERAMLSAQLESRRGVVGILTNSAQNMLFANVCRAEGGAPRAWVALQRDIGAPEASAVEDMGAHLLFAAAQDLELWAVRVRRGGTRLEVWEWDRRAARADGESAIRIPPEARDQLIPLLLRRGKKRFLIDESTEAKDRDQVEWLIFSERTDAAHDWLRNQGWRLSEEVGAVEGEDS